MATFEWKLLILNRIIALRRFAEPFQNLSNHFKIEIEATITVMIKEGHAHHPHSLQNAKPIADWIEQHMHPTEANRPAFVDSTFTKGHFYSLDNSFIYLKEEDTYATARGPGFVPSYDRYDGPTSGNFRTGGM